MMKAENTTNKKGGTHLYGFSFTQFDRCIYSTHERSNIIEIVIIIGILIHFRKGCTMHACGGKTYEKATTKQNL